MFSTAVEQKVYLSIKPLIPNFTLTQLNLQGALTGLVTGLAFSLWIGFGGPKPPIPRLPLRNDGCAEFLNATIDSTTEQYLSTISPSALPTGVTPADDYFPLYRVSFMWYAPLGFLLTVLVAQVVSRIVRLSVERRGVSGQKINEELLSPMFPQCFRTSHHLPDPNLLLTPRENYEEKQSHEDQTVSKI
ncbi:putative sodium-dependent multivitamin transporter [Daphnia carinata]|uniref:putative sodium-dependent multivitamin transporter n=1 Tax=Daphnia carinata TaxID=120202 RepID=UPI0028688247|nr:putative sodium-dependent multivitamin transporter [Daphnia carinata]